MAVTPDQVRHVARLARLRPDDAEIARLTRELNSILEHVNELAEADVTGIEAVGGVAAGAAPRRADGPGADPLALPPSDLAPAWAEGFFTVPRLAALGGSAEEE